MNNIASEWLKNYLHIFFYKKVFIRRSVIFTCVLAVVVYIVPPPVYLGTFSVLVRTSDMDTTRILPGTGVFAQPEAVNPGVMSSEQALMTSDRVLAKALEETYKKYPDLSFSSAPYFAAPVSALFTALGKISSFIGTPQEESADDRLHRDIESFRKLIVATPLPGARTIDVEVTFYDRAILDELQKKLLDAYLNTRGELITNPRGQNIYSQDSQRYGEHWQKLLGEAAKLRSESSLFDITAQRSELVTQYHSLQKEIDMLHLRVAELNNQIKLVQTADSVIGLQLHNLSSSQVFAQMEDEIARMEMERSKMTGQYTPENPELRRMQLGLQNAKKQYKALLLNTLSQSKKDTSDRLSLLTGAAAALETKLRDIDSVGNRLAELEQETELAQESYQTYVRKLREVQLQSMLRTASENSIAVIHSPYVDGKPFWPNALLLFPLALFLGAFFGIIGAYVEYYFEDVVLQPSDLRFTGLPVLLSVPDRPGA